MRADNPPRPVTPHASCSRSPTRPIAWYHRDLHWLSHVPFINLTGILVGLPAVASLAGWLLAGREPAAVARSPLD